VPKSSNVVNTFTMSAQWLNSSHFDAILPTFKYTIATHNIPKNTNDEVKKLPIKVLIFFLMIIHAIENKIIAVLIVHTAIAPNRILPIIPNRNKITTIIEDVIGIVSSYFLSQTAAHSMPPEDNIANHIHNDIILLILPISLSL
jgi:hypothetical protein